MDWCLLLWELLASRTGLAGSTGLPLVEQIGSLKHGHAGFRARWVSPLPVHVFIARQKTADYLDSLMGRRQVSKDFRRLCILWVPWVRISDDLCNCILYSVNLNDFIAGTTMFPFLFYSRRHGFRPRRQDCALFCPGLWGHWVARLCIAMVVLSIHTAGGRQNNRAPRYTQVVSSLTEKRVMLFLSEVS